jgi:hypothetical protein
MPDYKVLITDGLDPAGQAILHAAAQVEDRNNISADELLKVIPEYDARG